MKKLLFVLLLANAVLFTGCKSKQQVVNPYNNEVEVTVPCKEFKSDKTAIRANANAISPNMQNATDKALAAARAELATSLNVQVKRVADRYTSSYETDQASDYRGRFQDLSRQVVNEMLTGSNVVCDKVTKTTNKDGSVMYHAYVAVEITADDIVSEITNKVSKEDKLRIDYDYEKYKKVFDEEMANFER